MTARGATAGRPERRASLPDLTEVLELEATGENRYRANAVVGEDLALYGGQVAAQALRAAGLTVGPDRRPHSLHGYFLRRGDSSLPSDYEVFRDRDGGSFSARRVVAIQRGEVIFSMAASFHAPRETWASQAEPMPATQQPDDLRPSRLHRLVSMESRFPEQPFADQMAWPTRFWARVTVPLPPDPLVQACALTYLSDISTGIMPAGDGSARPGPSLDHAVWFHHPANLNDWGLLEYHPRVTGNGRGWYNGSIFRQDGTLVASLAQEQLFR
jgi:acyl-CoA thioesterase-2